MSKEEQVPIQYKSYGSKEWTTMRLYHCGRTIEQVVRDMNEGEKKIPFGCRCMWRIPREEVNQVQEKI